MNVSMLYRCASAGLLTLVWQAACAQDYTYVTVNPRGSIQTTPVALDGSGTVLGYWDDSNYDTHGFTFQNGSYTNIDYPKAIYTQPTGFNTRGEIVGSYTDSAHVVHNFLYKNGKFRSPQAPGATYTEFAGVSAGGVVLGFSSAGSGSAFTLKGHIFTTINDQDYVSPVALNNTGSAIGNYFPPQPQPITTWLYSGGSLITLPIKSDDAVSSALNNKGDVVGMQTVGSVAEGFLYRNGNVKSILVPQSTGTYPEAITDQGDITGYYSDVNYNEFGFVLSKGRFVTLTAPNAAGTYCLAINTAGQVLGGYHDANRNQYTFLATPSN